jgi:pantoate--beta-alanine ligase
VLNEVAAGHPPAKASEALSVAGWQPDYIEVRRRADLAPAQPGHSQRVVLGAARLGGTRNIDNL